MVIMVLSVGVISAFATESEYGRNFVDADKNGICDFAGDFCRYVDADHDGICDNRGTGQNGCANNFADADGDSICDNYPGQGMGQKCGFGADAISNRWQYHAERARSEQSNRATF